MKFKSTLLIIFTLAATVALSACSAPPPHETKIVYHPMGEIGLGMTVRQIERRIGDEGFFMSSGDVFVIDYDRRDIDLAISYDTRGDTAFGIRMFGPGRTFNGITIGMSYEEVLAICGEYAVEEILGDEYDDEDGVRFISLLFNERSEPVTLTFDDEGFPITSDRVFHLIEFEFNDDGFVNMIAVKYDYE